MHFLYSLACVVGLYVYVRALFVQSLSLLSICLVYACKDVFEASFLLNIFSLFIYQKISPKFLEIHC